MSSALEEEGAGFIMTSSRQVLYASPGPDFATAARQAALALRDEIHRLREAVLSGRS